MTNTKTILTTLVLGAALALSGCGGGGSSASSASNGYPDPVPFDAPPIDEATKQAYLDAINAARAVGRNCGDTYMPPAPPLQWSDALYRAAAEHNYDMVASGIYQHEGSGTESDWTAQVQDLEGGSDSSTRITNNGYTFSSAGENLYACSGGCSISTAVNGWLNSKDHCIILMSPSFTDVGISKITSSSTKWHDYYTMNLAKPL